uniref:Uncharacterized protein n=1 Tax=Crocodylus porosus TaxID=8502 RepID=A0A7M4EEN8_CROPO
MQSLWVVLSITGSSIERSKRASRKQQLRRQDQPHTMFGRWVSALFLLVASCLGLGSCGKVQVWPADDSHWIDIKSFLQELTGHEGTVTSWPCFQTVDPTKPSSFSFEMIMVPIAKEEMRSLTEDFLQLHHYKMSRVSYWGYFSRLFGIASKFISRSKLICDELPGNKEWMKKLRGAAFEVVLADPIFPCSDLVAEQLSIPFIYTFCFSTSNTVERTCGGIPAPASYVPASVSGLTDHMSFMERMKSTLTCSVMFCFTRFSGENRISFTMMWLPTPGRRSSPPVLPTALAAFAGAPAYCHRTPASALLLLPCPLNRWGTRRSCSPPLAPPPNCFSPSVAPLGAPQPLASLAACPPACISATPCLSIGCICTRTLTALCLSTGSLITSCLTK